MHTFFDRHPALLYGIFFLLGVSYGFTHYWLLIIFVIFLLMVLLTQKDIPRLVFAVSLFLTAIFWVKTTYSFPGNSTEYGIAEIELQSIASQNTHFGKRWIYKGTLLKFTVDEKETAKNIPISFSIRESEDGFHPNANQKYQIYAKLKQSTSGNYSLTVEKNAPWYPIEGSWSFAELRYTGKEAVGKYIQSKYSIQSVASFLSGIATGEFDDKQLSFEFSRFGLQHIMAISGFHFSIIAAFFGFFLRFFLSFQLAASALVFLMTFYFLFLGVSPSILRAWIMAMLPILAILIGRRSSSLNSLGLALLCTLLWDPFFYKNVGFQYSFAATAAILMLTSFLDVQCQKVFPKRSLTEALEMNFMTQHAYCFLVFCRQSIALMIAVNAVVLPITLYYFQQFPILGLLYNLFFPFLVSISLLLLLVGVLLGPFGGIVHYINEHFTNFVLNLTSNFPISLDIVWKVQPFSPTPLIIYLFAILLFGIYCSRKQQQ